MVGDVAERDRIGADASAGFGRAALAVVLLAVPVRLALALSTDLSPDEAYYLCAARRAELVPAMPDHPPLLPWLLRLGEALPVPPELRVRIWPLLLSTALGLLCVELARRRGATRSGQQAAAWLGSWSLLPMAGGFVATPDGPALLACAALLWWSSGAQAPGRRASRQPAMTDLAAGAAAVLGTMAKVITAPVAAVVAVASVRPAAVRTFIAIAPWLSLPWLLPSLRFQARHALTAPPEAAWHPLDATGAVLTAALAQLALWSPWVVAVGVASCWASARRRPVASPPQAQTPREHALVVALFTALVLVSAVVRAVPPEPNWWAPAALVVVVAAAVHAGQLAPARRAAMLATAVVPTLVAVTHVAAPWLPLPLALDPTARLHGWSRDRPPLQAPGIGAYGPAAERCIYLDDCDEIHRHFEEMRRQM